VKDKENPTLEEMNASDGTDDYKPEVQEKPRSNHSSLPHYHLPCQLKKKKKSKGGKPDL